jgi:large subunit ribosomal protein L16
MKQFPSRQKFKKYHKPSLNSYKSNTSKMFMPLIGQYALKALSAGKLNFKQLESGRRAIRRTTKKRGQIKIQVFTYASITKKPVASRMGKGKGNHSI